MRFSVASDIHLEFGNIDLRNESKADVLILAGDIIIAHELKFITDENKVNSRTWNFFYHVSNQFDKVIYIMGNHEHYRGDFAFTEQKIRDFLKDFPNVIFLEKSAIEIGDTMFIGATMWTNFNKNDELMKLVADKSMNDFRIIQNSNKMVNYRQTYITEKGEERTRPATRPGTFRAQDAYEDNCKAIEYFTEMLKTHNKVVMVTHHSPSMLSVHEKYKGSNLNYAYSSANELFVMNHPQIKYWVHGHTHESFDYMLGDTRIVCNPRGYIGYEQRADAFELKTFEV